MKNLTPKQLTDKQMARIIDVDTKQMFDRLGTAALVAVSQGRDIDVLDALISERNNYLKQGVGSETVQHDARSVPGLVRIFGIGSPDPVEEQ